jgi:transcriptional regulator with XRE-family HTH domain
LFIFVNRIFDHIVTHNSLKMIDRIHLILKTKGLSPSQFADAIQVKRSGMSHVLSGRNNPSLDFVLKILETYSEIDPEWLLHGRGSMLKTNKEPLSKQIIEKPGKTDLAEIPFPEMSTEKTADGRPQKQTTPAIKKTPVSKENKWEGNVEKIVVFYNNNTFREYYPED